MVPWNVKVILSVDNRYPVFLPVQLVSPDILRDTIFAQPFVLNKSLKIFEEKREPRNWRQDWYGARDSVS
jgi:hypothetical protein